MTALASEHLLLSTGQDNQDARLRGLAGLGGWEREGFPGGPAATLGTAPPQDGPAQPDPSGDKPVPGAATAPSGAGREMVVADDGSTEPHATYCFHYRPRWEAEHQRGNVCGSSCCQLGIENKHSLNSVSSLMCCLAGMWMMQLMRHTCLTDCASPRRICRAYSPRFEMLTATSAVGTS